MSHLAKMSKSAKSVVPIAAAVGALLAKAKKQKGKKSKAKKSGKAKAAGRIIKVTSAYAQALSMPFKISPTRLGFGTLVPTALESAFTRSAVTPASAAVAFAFVSQPNVSSITRYFESIGSGSVLTAPATSYNASNSSMITAVAQFGRVVSMGMRVTVKWAATNIRGSMGALFLPRESDANFVGMTYNGLMNLQATEWSTEDGNSMTLEVQYRPLDSASYDFSGFQAGIPYVAAESRPLLSVVGTGWVAGSYTLEFETIMHIETIGGLDSAASDGETAKYAMSADEALSSVRTAGDPIRDVTAGLDYVTKAAHLGKSLHAAWRSTQWLRTAGVLKTLAATRDATAEAIPVYIVPSPPVPEPNSLPTTSSSPLLGQKEDITEQANLPVPSAVLRNSSVELEPKLDELTGRWYIPSASATPAHPGKRFA